MQVTALFDLVFVGAPIVLVAALIMQRHLARGIKYPVVSGFVGLVPAHFVEALPDEVVSR